MNKTFPEVVLVWCSLGCSSRIRISATKCWSTITKKRLAPQHPLGRATAGRVTTEGRVSRQNPPQLQGEHTGQLSVFNCRRELTLYRPIQTICFHSGLCRVPAPSLQPPYPSYHAPPWSNCFGATTQPVSPQSTRMASRARFQSKQAS